MAQMMLETPLKFNSLPLKNGWKAILSYWGKVTFQGRAVKLRGGKCVLIQMNLFRKKCIFREIKTANLLKHFRRESFVWKKFKRFKHHPTTIQTPFLKLEKCSESRKRDGPTAGLK